MDHQPAFIVQKQQNPFASAAKHTHAVFDLAGGKQLRFRDIRRFGGIQVIGPKLSLDGFFLTKGLGPEPFALKAAYWKERFTTTSRPLKAVLLDQQVVAGVGNIYADESLFEARLYPGRRASKLTEMERQRLRKAIVTVLRRAIVRKGSSIRDYVGGLGLPGGYQREFRVYGRQGEPCPRCRTPIVRIRLAGRSTHYCPRCQPNLASSLSNGRRVRKVKAVQNA
jgi:formamidopyrimidine-DNA glycosylase